MSLNPQILDWHGRVVWMIGASSGIGLATAHALHVKGARVIVSSRNEQALNDFVAQHSGSMALPLDVTQREAVQQAALFLQNQGALDVVCYCAGIYHAMRATALDLDKALLQQQVNLTGAWYVLAGVIPALLAQGSGHINLVSSVAGFRGLPQGLAYGPTKAALIHLAEGLFLDLRRKGIGVSVITPGFVATPATAGNDFAMPALLTPEQAAQAMLKGWAQGAFQIHFPKRFTCWMKLLRLLPYGLYFSVIHKFTGL